MSKKRPESLKMRLPGVKKSYISVAVEEKTGDIADKDVLRVEDIDTLDKPSERYVAYDV